MLVEGSENAGNETCFIFFLECLGTTEHISRWMDESGIGGS